MSHPFPSDDDMQNDESIECSFEKGRELTSSGNVLARLGDVVLANG